MNNIYSLPIIDLQETSHLFAKTKKKLIILFKRFLVCNEIQHDFRSYICIIVQVERTVYTLRKMLQRLCYFFFQQ